MLKKLRDKKTARKIWIILAVLVVPAFVLWGLGGAIKSRQESNYVGIIFGRKIPILEYKEAYDAVKNLAIMQFGENFSEVQKNLNLESQAWDRLILLAEARKHNINTDDREVIEFIKEQPFFQRNGKFDNQVYYQLLQYVFHSPARVFEEQMRQNIILAKLYHGVTNNVDLSEEEIKEEYIKANEEVSIYYIASLPFDFISGVNPTEEDLKKYFTQKSTEFKQPLSFNIDYVSAEAEDAIRDILSRLNKKEDFTKIAKDLGLQIKETGLFAQNESIPGFGWSPQILEVVSKLKLNEFSQPIYIDKNYYIFRLKERKEPYVPDLETIKDKVREEFIKSRAKEIARDKIEICLKNLKEEFSSDPKKIDFEKLAKNYGLKSGTTNPFKYGSYIENIGSSDTFWLAAHKLKGDEFSDILDTPTGFYIIRLKSRLPIENEKFEKERSEFSQKLLFQKKNEYFVKFVTELKRKAQLF